MPWTISSSLLCSWDFPGKNTGAGSIFSPRGSSQPRDWTWDSFVSCIRRQILHHWATGRHITAMWAVIKFEYGPLRGHRERIVVTFNSQELVQKETLSRFPEWIAVGVHHHHCIITPGYWGFSTFSIYSLYYSSSLRGRVKFLFEQISSLELLRFYSIGFVMCQRGETWRVGLYLRVLYCGQ